MERQQDMHKTDALKRPMNCLENDSLRCLFLGGVSGEQTQNEYTIQIYKLLKQNASFKRHIMSTIGGEYARDEYSIKA